MKKALIGLLAFGIIVVIGIGISFVLNATEKSKVTAIYGAVGGGKENLLNDDEFKSTLKEDYKIEAVNDAWSNGKLIVDELTYEKDGVSHGYDFVFFSDERFFEYYKTPANTENGEAPRNKVLKTSIALNTPIVIYSWDKVVDTFVSEGIAEQRNGVYYIKDMDRLLGYITEGKEWADIGMPEIYGKINIASTDPVTSSPGATYYGLLGSIMSNSNLDEDNISAVMPQLTEFYKLSGFMNNTPADLFELYLRTGMGAKPMIVDYEKSIIDFANQNPEGYEQVKDRIRILYPEPTIWNSHCIMSFTENGNKFIDALNSKAVQDLAWKKYGFRTGLAGGSYDAGSVSVGGVPQDILSVVQGLRKSVYDVMIEELSSSMN